MVLPPLTQAGAPNLYQPDAAANRPLPGEMPAQSHTLHIAVPMPLNGWARGATGSGMIGIANAI